MLMVMMVLMMVMMLANAYDRIGGDGDDAGSHADVGDDDAAWVLVVRGMSMMMTTMTATTMSMPFFVGRRITLLCPCACFVSRLYSMARIHNSKLYNVAVFACASLLIEVV